jgi:putative ABC transport system permease protein
VAFFIPKMVTPVAKIKKWFKQDLYLVLKTQVAEYKNKPLLHLAFILSLAIATSTLLSVLVLNHASKEQYQQANSLLKNPVGFHIIAQQGSKLKKDDFSSLRKQGFTQITPVLTFRKKLTNGKYITFTAIDLLALSLIKAGHFNSQRVLLTEDYVRSLLLFNEGKHFFLADNRAIPFSIRPAGQWQDQALLDITLAWKLFPEEGDFSYLLVAPLSEQSKKILESVLPAHLSLYEPWSVEERQGFADALHLNLNVLAILGFIVSLFIAFQAANQAWRKRAQLTAQLRLLGVQLFTIKIALIIEALFLVIMATVLGILLAIGLVSILLPLLGLTLKQLYSLNSSGHLNWQWSYNLWAFLISLLAVLLALMKQFKLLSSKYIARSAHLQSERFSARKNVIATLLLLALFILWPNNSWLQLMIKYAFLLLGSIAFLPVFLQSTLFLGANLGKSFRFKFLIKDASQQIQRRYLPLAAFYLALTASIAAALLVNSFENAFVRYLDQQLNADIFISHKAWQKKPIEDWLGTQSALKEYTLFQHSWAKIETESVKLVNHQSLSQLESLLLKSSDHSDEQGCYINEQLALKKKLSIGGGIKITQGQQVYQCNIKGIYYEYGYPGYSVTVNNAPLTTHFSGWVDTGFGLFFESGQLITKQQIVTALNLDYQQVYQPQQIKILALEIFSQTFILIQAITAVLLLVACFGLFLSAQSLELARKSDLYILYSLGYDKKALFIHMLVQWLLLVLCSIILSWPIATLLANALVTQVLPASFGWSMPLMINIAPFVVSSLLGLLLLIPAVSIPLLTLNVRKNLCP